MNLSYEIDIKNAKKHTICIQLHIDSPVKSGQIFWLPDWIPGSYLIRDFSKNITSIKAYSNNEPVQLIKIDKSKWRLSQDVDCLNIEYAIYAWDLSVRSAHFDEQHCFFNGTSVFLAVDGYEFVKHQVTISLTEHSKKNNWSIATSLPVIQVDKAGFGSYESENYTDLIDHPFEIAKLQTADFVCHDTPHRMVFSEAPENIDLERIANDVQAICD